MSHVFGLNHKFNFQIANADSLKISVFMFFDKTFTEPPLHNDRKYIKQQNVAAVKIYLKRYKLEK